MKTENPITTDMLEFQGVTVSLKPVLSLAEDYCIHRMKTGRAEGGDAKTPPSVRGTLHQEIVCLQQVLQTRQPYGWLPYLPNISPPYKSSGKITHWTWFSPTECKQIYKVTFERAEGGKNERWRTVCEIFMTSCHSWSIPACVLTTRPIIASSKSKFVGSAASTSVRACLASAPVSALLEVR